MLTRTKIRGVLLLSLLCLTMQGVAAAPASRANEAAAQAAFDAGQYKEAVVQYQRLLRERPADAGYRMKLAESYEISGNPDRAAEHAEVVLKMDKRNTEALLMMGRLNGRRQDWETAKSYYEWAVRADKSNAAAYLGLGQSLMELGNGVGADAAFAEYLQISNGRSNPAKP